MDARIAQKTTTMNSTTETASSTQAASLAEQGAHPLRRRRPPQPGRARPRARNAPRRQPPRPPRHPKPPRARGKAPRLRREGQAQQDYQGRQEGHQSHPAARVLEEGHRPRDAARQRRRDHGRHRQGDGLAEPHNPGLHQRNPQQENGLGHREHAQRVRGPDVPDHWQVGFTLASPPLAGRLAAFSA